MKKIFAFMTASLMVAIMSVMAVPASYAQTATGRATIFNPGTGEKLIVNIGDPVPPGWKIFKEAKPAARTTTTTTTTSAATTVTPTTTSLGDLIILDRLFNTGGVLNSNGVLGNGGSDLGDLFILNQLFGGGGTIFNSRTGAGSTNLSNLFTLDALFGGRGGVLGGGGVLGNNGNLGDLFILNNLFSNGTGGLFR